MLFRECPRCRSGDEMVIHALRNCPKAQSVLVVGGFNNRLFTKEYEFCIDWLEDSMRLFDRKAFEDFTTILWNIWNDRNNAILGGVPRDCKWEKPSEGVAKVNVDASVKENRVGLGIILRDSYGFVLCGRAIFIDKAANSK
ncbi:hypothetical protein J1N35_015099 [Gossypium stocksii]|uniref:RNase H type-1 domain-containing protein n=1 Tax=Gossypium stocksii TaxID=47602 RepID=A0A9D4A893_9ROSI|nr:hypothetical protein J1N35_015099 [Gossypium stocksii]